jgi:opacity protein-like surface antigen
VPFSMRILFSALFCSLLFTAPASAQSTIAGGSGETSPAASAEVSLAPIKPVKPIRSGAPVATAKSKTIEIGLGYSYVSQPGNQSNRLGLQGGDANFTIGFSRLGITTDVGYARASNVLGTGRNSAVLTYLAGPVFHHTVHHKFDSYVHLLVGGAKVSGPILTNDGTILLGGWTTGYAWAVGGGVEFWATDSMAIRTGADYLRTSFYNSSLVVQGQGNIRSTASVVYFFGVPSRRLRHPAMR